MNIDGSIASQLYGSALSATRPGADGVLEGGGGSFAEALEAAARDMMSTIREGERTAQAAMEGKADVQSVVEALAATDLALQTAVTLRDQVVEAYRELLRMPV